MNQDMNLSHSDDLPRAVELRFVDGTVTVLNLKWGWLRQELGGRRWVGITREDGESIWLNTEHIISATPLVEHGA